MHKPLSCVWISERVVDDMVRESDAKFPKETGGVLLAGCGKTPLDAHFCPKG